MSDCCCCVDLGATEQKESILIDVLVQYATLVHVMCEALIKTLGPVCILDYTPPSHIYIT